MSIGKATQLYSSNSRILLVFLLAIGVVLQFAVPNLLSRSIWICFLWASSFWHTNLAPGTIPAYMGVTVGLNDKTVERLWFGYDEACPAEYFIVTSNIAKRIKDLQIEDVRAFGMVPNLDPTFGDTAYCMGIAPFKSYCEFKNGLLITFQARHSEFKFAKTPDGPFFSLPIAFDEYQKMFGKPLRWKREVSGKRVP